ncbi:MAG: UDP-N-acetylmuramoyl-tripeptide--D-alanyl-D-alanine ligase [Oxalobacteraceae bacterium]
MKSSLLALQSSLSGVHAQGDAIFDGVTTDSRNANAGNLFVALRGEHFDAHDFIAEIVSKGVSAVVAERLPANCAVPALIVPDTRIALGEIARHWRRQFSVPIIGVTGSNGKTTVKEMIGSIMAAQFGAEHYLATRGNLNNDIGVPLTLLRMTAAHRAAVIELGMNHRGEIALLASIAQPTLGLVNNAQREHQEFMESVEAVARENGAVISALPINGIAVFPADDTYTPLWREYAKSAGHRKIATFGFSTDADVTCSYRPNAFGNDLSVTADQHRFDISLAAAGTHNVRNALAAIACTLAIGIEVEAIVHGLAAFTPVNGRLQHKTARNGAAIIDDTYNANPDSVRAAIDVLAQAPAPRVLVLGDMGEVGNDGRQFHEEIGEYARGCGIEHVMTFGALACHTAAAYGSGAIHFDGIKALNDALEAILVPEATILVKGSRFMKMERTVHHLVQEHIKESH